MYAHQRSGGTLMILDGLPLQSPSNGTLQGWQIQWEIITLDKDSILSDQYTVYNVHYAKYMGNRSQSCMDILILSLITKQTHKPYAYQR